MFEHKRVYNLTEVPLPADRHARAANIYACATKMADETQTLCTGFMIGEYLFLNDATCEDGAHEYAVLKIKQEIEQPNSQIKVLLCDKVESGTMDWMGVGTAALFIGKIIEGMYDTPIRVDMKINVDISTRHSCKFCE